MIWYVAYVFFDPSASKWIQEICHKLGIFLLLGGSWWKRKFLDSDVVVHIAQKTLTMNVNDPVMSYD